MIIDNILIIIYYNKNISTCYFLKSVLHKNWQQYENSCIKFEIQVFLGRLQNENISLHTCHVKSCQKNSFPTEN